MFIFIIGIGVHMIIGELVFSRHSAFLDTCHGRMAVSVNYVLYYFYII